MVAVRQESRLVELQCGHTIECEDGSRAQVRAIGLSPIYEEERAGILRLYVVGDGWADWVLPRIQVGGRVYASADGLILS